jgi:DNA-binding response OmpR family regulator
MSGRIESPRERSFFKEALKKNASDAMSAQLKSSLLRGRSIKVLHIEDDAGVARSIARILRANGFEVASAASRDEALQQLELHGFRPDLILTDFQLENGVKGDAVVAEIASRLQFKPPIIMLTGTAGREAADSKSFADRTLAKPVDIDVLLTEIENLLRERV